MNDNQVTTEQKSAVVRSRGGRPRSPEPGSAVTTWLPASYHDRLIKLAQQHETTVSSLVKQLLILRLKP